MYEMTSDHVRKILEREAEKIGSQTALAKHIGVSPAYVHDVINGRREPGESILKPLGLEKSPTSYRWIKER